MTEKTPAQPRKKSVEKKAPERKLWRWIVGAVLAVFILVVAGFLIWSFSPYQPDQQAKTALAHPTQAQTSYAEDGTLIFTPIEQTNNCLIFYSGAHTIPEDYTPLLNSFANVGYTVFAPNFPLHYAILADNQAEKIFQLPQASNCQNWVGVGHSLGATALSRYVARHPQAFNAVLFLAAEPWFFAKDLTNYSGALVSAIGDRDSIIDQTKWESLRDHLPASAFLVTLPGANHTQFGNYGLGADRPAQISAIEQQLMTLETLLIMTNQYDPQLLNQTN